LAISPKKESMSASVASSRLRFPLEAIDTFLLLLIHLLLIRGEDVHTTCDSD
jgi:hypothetical protein